MESLKFFILIILLASCGVKREVAQAPEIERFTQLQLREFSGVFQDLSGNNISIQNFSRPTILIFASETCSVCRKEGRLLAETFKKEGLTQPSNVDFYTIMVGNDFPEDAEFFARSLGIEWAMGVNTNDEIFIRLCRETVTPCIVTFHPQKQTVYKFIGETEFSQLQEATELWEF